jgi:hypothetical protein
MIDSVCYQLHHLAPLRRFEGIMQSDFEVRRRRLEHTRSHIEPFEHRERNRAGIVPTSLLLDVSASIATNESSLNNVLAETRL